MTTNSSAVSPPESGGAASAAAAAAASSSLNGREARNLAEKHRRDKLNASIQELATMVPHVAESTRRLDKTAVLRFAAHGLRIQHVFGKSAERKRLRRNVHAPDTSDQLWQLQLTDMLMHIVDSFLITLTCHGQIVLISASVEELLGHCQSDLYGQSILQITHPEDHALLRQQLIPRDMESLFRGGGAGGSGAGMRDDDADSGQSHGQSHRRRHLHSTAEDEDLSDQDELDDMEVAPDSDDASEAVGNNGQHSYRSSSTSPQRHNRAHLAEIDERLRSDRRCFTVRLARAGGSARSTESSSTGPAAAAGRSYECVKIDGYFRRSDCSTSAGNFPIVSQLIRRSRASSNSSTGGGGAGELPLQHDAIAQAALHGISGNDIVLVAIVRIIHAPRILYNVSETHQLEYKTRHLIDGRIVDCDPRISLVAGYMQNEVCQLSPFSFMHQDDVKFVIVALREMYDLNQDYGESCFRLLTRNGHFIYLQSKGTFEVHPESNEVVTFTCINTLLDEETGRRKLYEMKTKFEMMINSTVASNSLEDAPASINPQQLERIVFYLIENLHQRHERHHSGMSESAATDELNWDQASRYARTPPLALVPPAPDSVKVSLSKSIKVVNVTAAKNLQHNQRASSLSHCGSSEASLSPASSVDQNETSTATTSNSTATSTEAATVSTEIVNSATHLQRRPSVLQMSGAREQLQPRTPSPSNFHAPPAIVSPPHHRSYGNKQKFASLPKTLFSASSATVTVINDEEIDAAEEEGTHSSPSKRMRAQDAVAADASCSSPTSTSFASPSSYSSSLSPSAASSTTSDVAEFHNAISATIEHVDQTLYTIGQNVRSLVQQRARLPPVSSAAAESRRIIDQRLDAIQTEHRQEQKILSNIKHELGVGVVPAMLVVKKTQPHPESQLQQNLNAYSNRTTASTAIIIAPTSSSTSTTTSTSPFAAPNVAPTLLAKLPDSTTLIRRGKPL